MKIISWNVNGLRAAERKGFLDWLAASDADVVLLQETKARPEQLGDGLRSPAGFHVEFASAARPGYSGVAVYSRRRPDELSVGLGIDRFDAEGRVVMARFGNLAVLGAYFPNGGRDCSRVPFKLDFYDAMLAHVGKLCADGHRVVLAGDYNTAHREVDLARPQENVRTTGFLPEERAWIDRYVEAGWVDTFRHAHPEVRDRYTWWAPWQSARKKNIGWRIDYHFVDRALARDVVSAEIHDDVLGSDHCPVSLVIAE